MPGAGIGPLRQGGAARSRRVGSVRTVCPASPALPHSTVSARTTAAAAVAYRLTPSWTARRQMRRRRLS